MHQRTRQLLIRFSVCLLIFGFASGQSVPIPLDHPVNDFILRLSTLNKVQAIHQGLRPFTIEQIVTALNEISSEDLSINEKQLLKRFKQEFDFIHFDYGIHGPWQGEQLRKINNRLFNPYDSKNNELRFITYNDEELTLWADWEELFSVKIQDSLSRAFYNDQVTISGRFNNNLSFYSRYSLFRVGHKDSYPLPEEFKQGYILLEKNTDWLVWDVSEASLRFNNTIINVELSKIPIYWGYSKNYSPILSANVQSFSFLRFSKDYKRVRARSFIGSLDPFADNRKGIIEEKHIAAHRFEFDLTPSFTVSFNEMVIYARRNLELGYLLPVNLFWSEEHGLGNRDNILMSFDAYWNVKPGLSVYGTFFWDELSWFKLFSHWWGNKFIFQSGFHWVPFINPQLPDFRVEWTVSRPWVYTHNDSLLTFTSSEIGLGLPSGPNSQLLFLEMNMWPTYKTKWSINLSYLIKGSGIGSDPNDNYRLRNKLLDDNTPMLMGKVRKDFIISSELHSRITDLLSITANFSYYWKDDVSEGRIGILMNY